MQSENARGVRIGTHQPAFSCTENQQNQFQPRYWQLATICFKSNPAAIVLIGTFQEAAR